MKRLINAIKKIMGHRNPLRLFWHHAKAFIAALINGFPARRLTIIGITGTDGKTTTVGMTAHILHSAGIPVGALSTAFLMKKNGMQWNATQKTSPSPFLIQRFLRSLVRSGCTHAVIEASSHGLVQGRLQCTWPLVAAITNTTPEHLDYHGTMEQYRRDKGLLFQMLRKGGTKVLNADDGSLPMYLAIPSAHTYTYASQSSADFSASDIHETQNGVQGTLSVQKQNSALPLTLKLHGIFNIENALAAIACAHAVGVPITTSLQALSTFPGVPGRLERIDAGQSFTVYVDFTVTPASYEKTLSTLRTMLTPGKKLLVLTGSCGDRMREKRPIVGGICSRLADIVVVTNEDPYTEDPQKIIDEVWNGIDQSHCEAHRIFDRHEAIAFIFRKAQAGDIVILCAKGSDTTMMTATGQIPWNEREIARELLQQSLHS